MKVSGVRRSTAWLAAGVLLGIGALQAHAFTAPSGGLKPIMKVTWTKTSMSARGEIGGQVRDPAMTDAPTPANANSAPAAPPPTPSAVYGFSTGTSNATRADVGGNPADSNVAATRTNICITTRGGFACYTKAGTLIAPGPRLAARPYAAADFFAASGINVATSYDNSTTNKTKDGRVIYDQKRARLFMVFQTREQTGRLLIAVSKSANPRDGWWTYADTVGTADANQHDYDMVGMSGSHLLVMNSPVATPDQPNPGRFPGRNYLYTADDLAAGQAYSRGEWSHAAAFWPSPAVNNTTVNDAFWVNRDDATHVSIWAVRNGTVYRRTITVQTAGSPVFGAQPNGPAVVFDIIGMSPQNADYRSGKITFAANVGHTWSGQSSPSNAIQLNRINLANYFANSPSMTLEIDRIFGRAAPGDSSISDYGWPAVATNGLGDIVVGEIRCNSTTYAELRGSVWLAGESDISSSVLVKAGSSALRQYHMAGAMADPSTNGVYISQEYGSGLSDPNPGWLIRVAKILGVTRPDIYQDKIVAPGSAARGTSISVSLTVLNQGDAAMPASSADIRLSTDAIISTSDTLLKQISVPALSPGQSKVITVSVIIPARTTAGTRWIGAILDRDGVATEYNDSNQNPRLGSSRGNRQINLT